MTKLLMVKKVGFILLILSMTVVLTTGITHNSSASNIDHGANFSGAYSAIKLVSNQTPSDTRSAKSVENSVHNDENFYASFAIVVAMIVIVMIMFLWEPIRLDLLALSIPVILIILQPWTKINVSEALSGFSNKATITVLAMFMLSSAIYRSGLVQYLGNKIIKITGNNETRQIGFVSGLSGLIAGIINNTPVVAIFIPMVSEIAQKTKTSPSKLLIPLSYASMLGGMLTLLGTSTNILASDLSARLIGHGFSMFEFTRLGIIVLIVGILYLITLGRHLLPVRVNPEEEITEEYEMGNYLTEIVIEEDSPLVGKTVGESLIKSDFDINLVQIIRGEEKFVEPLENKYIQANDHLIIRTDQSTLIRVMKNQQVKILPKINITKSHLEEKKEGQRLVEIVIPHGSFMEGQTLSEINFLQRYNSTILAIRHGEEITHTRLENITIKAGNVLLLMVGANTLKRLRNNKNFIIINEEKPEDYRSSKIIMSISILGIVVALAALNILPIVISALGGVIAMVATGCLKPSEVYDSVNWEVIFLLAGLIPLGIALNKTGTAEFIAIKLLSLISSLPPIFILGFFYLLTVLLTNIISNNASVILMIPIAVDAAHKMGLNSFAFILAVTFAASSAFLTPVGYQTNLMVYSAGGYRFRDFMIVGAPLQLILAIVIPLLISIFWGV